MELTTAVRSVAAAPGGDATSSTHRSLEPHLRQIPRQYVRRPWVIDRLSTDAPITLVVGPAGTGKTVAAAAWAAERGDPIAWVSVVTAAGASDRFWPTIAESLGVGLAAGDAASNPADELLPGDAVLALAAVLDETMDRDAVLVIDNYHVAEDAGLAASMALFLRHLPDRLRVIIVSRRVPQLPLDRMRVSGDLCEIDTDDLRFSRPDAERLLEMVAPAIEPHLANTIVTTSDGWVAALRLGVNAWLAGCARGVESATSDVSDVSIEQVDDLVLHLGDFGARLDEFVMHEVLGGEPEVLVEFLSDIAVVHRTSVGLAEQIAQRADAGELLELAHCRGLFVSHGGVRQRYEIHPVVRHAVLRERERRDPARKTFCHERAAAWLERTDEVLDALEQWLRAGDHANALRLLAQRHVQLYEIGSEPMVREFLAKLSPEATSRDVSSLIDLAWCQMITDLPSFRENLEHAVWWSEHGGELDAAAARHLLALRGIAALSHGDWQLAERESRTALAEYPSWYDDAILRTTWNDVARAIALSERWDDGDDEVRELNVVLRRDRTRTLVLEATRALGMALAGCPVDALRVAGGVRTSAMLANLTVSSLELDCAEVIARRELGDAPDAAADLERLINLDLGPLTYVRGLAATELVQLHLDRGSIPDATVAFRQLERVATEEMNGTGGRTWLGRIGTVLAIDSGDHVQAAHWADMVADPFWGPVSRARTLFAAGAENVSATLDEAVARCPRHTVVLTMLRASTATDPESALKWIESAVRIASANNMLQTIASSGQVELIERIAWRLPSDWMDRLRRATAVVHPGVSTGPPLVVPLTVRERDVLRFLPSRLTLAEIAAELYVSVNTLKFHLKVIYRKLGVNSRAEAAEIARSWGRIDQR